jgi:hypothetical protein
MDVRSSDTLRGGPEAGCITLLFGLVYQEASYSVLRKPVKNTLLARERPSMLAARTPSYITSRTVDLSPQRCLE